MRIIVLLSCMALPLVSTAQNKYGNTPADSLTCIKNISLYREYFKQRNYQYAAPYWRNTLKTCPAAREYIYTDGVKIYEAFMKEHRDTNLRYPYVDSILLLLDKRIEYFGKASYVNSVKGLTLLKHQKSRYREAHNYLQSAYEQEGKNATSITIVGLMKAGVVKYAKQEDPVKKNALKAKSKALYTELAALCEKKIAEYENSNSKKARTYQKCLSQLQELISQIPD